MSYDSQAEAFGFRTYHSHKRVRAATITRIYSESCVHADPGASFTFDPAGKPKPEVGWYIVCYEDGYVSFSPPGAFEDGYKPAKPLAVYSDPHMDFGGAVKALKEGLVVQRDGWNGKGMHLVLQVPDANSKMTLPYIYMKTVQGDLVPWLASQTDMLAGDWVCLTKKRDAEDDAA